MGGRSARVYVVGVVAVAVVEVVLVVVLGTAAVFAAVEANVCCGGASGHGRRGRGRLCRGAWDSGGGCGTCSRQDADDVHADGTDLVGERRN